LPTGREFKLIEMGAGSWGGGRSRWAHIYTCRQQNTVKEFAKKAVA